MMGGEQSRLDMTCYKDAVDAFLMNHCEIDTSVACDLDELSIAFAFFLLTQKDIRRKISTALNEPCTYRLPHMCFLYDMEKWKAVSKDCLCFHLSSRNGIHVLAIGREMVLGVRIAQWPSCNDIAILEGKLINIADKTGAACDYVMKL